MYIYIYVCVYIYIIHIYYVSCAQSGTSSSMLDSVLGARSFSRVWFLVHRLGLHLGSLVAIPSGIGHNFAARWLYLKFYAVIPISQAEQFWSSQFAGLPSWVVFSEIKEDELCKSKQTHPRVKNCSWAFCDTEINFLPVMIFIKSVFRHAQSIYCAWKEFQRIWKS